MDFLDELEGASRRWPFIAKTLEEALTGTELESDEASHAIAAAETVAAARGRGREALREELSLWALGRVPKNIEELAKLAVRAISRVREDSEVADLWKQAGLEDEFHRQIDQLLERLRVAPKPRSSTPRVPLRFPDVRVKPSRVNPIRVKPIRVKPGDVFQVALPDGRYAYGRLARGKKYLNFHIYSKFSDLPGEPPIGSREYLFAASGIHSELEQKVCPIVGCDAWTESEEDPRFLLTPHCYPTGTLVDGRSVPTAECVGASHRVSYDLASLVQRITASPDDPAVREQWPILPDAEGRVRRIPWEQWNPEWGKKWEERRQKEAAESRPEKIKTKPGDVVQISLPDGRWAYARLAPTTKFAILQVYAAISNQPSQPPIGQREFMFAAAGMDYQIEYGMFPVVGYDPWTEGEQEPRFFLGEYPAFRIVENGSERPASAVECIGLICQLYYFNPAGFVQRIVDHPNGPSVSKEWPLLPGDDGKLRPMRWSEWNPEWAKKWKGSKRKRS